MFKHLITHNSKTLFKTPNFKTPISHFHNSRNTTQLSNPAIDFILNEVEDLRSSKTVAENTLLPEKPLRESGSKELSCVQVSHQWPEWVGFMEHLLKKGYFEELGASSFGEKELGAKDANRIRTACLNFGRHRFDLIRYLSRKDIQVIAGSGCPSLDRKVVNSGKRLRAHVGIDEGNVCSSCILRGDCERAYVKAREDEWGRTVDVMRFLLTYGLDSVTGLVENKPCLNERVKKSVRRLLKDSVELSMVELDDNIPKGNPSKWKSSMQGSSVHLADSQMNVHSLTHRADSQISVPTKPGDWICPKCTFLNFARNIKCLRCDELFKERLRKLGEDQDHLPLKKGDWICDTCNFFNFAKNTRCFQCKEKPPPRKINPGEWECESCNYINFRKNMICLKCDHRRPRASNSFSTSTQPNNSIGDNRLSRPYFGQGRQVEDARADADKWIFVEDKREDQDASNSWNAIPSLVDFPVVGGKTDLSRNVQQQASWKQEMAERNKSVVEAKENADEFKATIMERRPKFSEPALDEEMAGWFGCKRSEGRNVD